MASSHVLIFAATGYNTINILKCFKCSRFSQSHCKRLCQKKTSDSYGRDFQCSTFGYKSYLIFLIIDHNQGMSVIFSPFLESHKRDIWRFYFSSLSWRYLFSWNEALVDIILNDLLTGPYTDISRKIVGKSALDNPERYRGWFWMHSHSKRFERMTREATNVCLWVLKKGTKVGSTELQCQEQCIDHIPYYPSGLSRAHFVRQPFLK